MKTNKSFSLGDRILSFGFAIQGLITFFKTQHNAWIHLLATIVVIMCCFDWFDCVFAEIVLISYI